MRGDRRALNPTDVACYERGMMSVGVPLAKAGAEMRKRTH